MAYRHCFWRSDGQLDCRQKRPHKLYTTDQKTWQQFQLTQIGGGDRVGIQTNDLMALRQTRDHLRAQDYQSYNDISPRFDGGIVPIFAGQCAFERRWRIPTKFNYVPLYGTRK